MRRSPVRFALAAAIVAVSFPAFAQQTVWVDDGNCPGPGTGSQGNPYCRIQDALCFLKDNGGGTVRVLPGTYAESLRIFGNTQLVSTDGPAVTVINAAGKPCINADCTVGSTTSCSAVYFPSAAGTNSRIEGFRITGGAGRANVGTQIGGGVVVFGSSPVITRNEITGNTLASSSTKLFYGGGIYINGNDPPGTARPVITKNVIQGNVADPPPGTNQNNFSEASGGGIYVGYNASAIIEDNAILSNRVGDPAKANQFGSGGGIALYARATGVETIVRGNRVSDNNASDYGAGISFGEWTDGASFTWGGRATIDSNTFDLNGGVDGGAIGTATTAAVIRGNTIFDNNASHAGGGVYFGESIRAGEQATFANNLVIGNHATGTGQGGGLFVTLSNPVVRGNDLQGNTPGNVAGDKSDADYIGVDGNVSVVPGFSSTIPPVDLHLGAGSPVIDAGDPAYAGPRDFDGFPRVEDGNLDGNARIDMGAFEFSPDSDGDGLPNAVDPDDDDDGALDGSDCAPRNRSVAQIAGAVGATLRASKSGTEATLSWGRSAQGFVYNVYRGTFGGGQPFGYNESCFSTELPRTQASDPAIPPAGAGSYYLVTGKNCCGESDATLDGQGQPHAPAASCGTVNADTDADTFKDLCDNCAVASNPTQADADADFAGDLCDNCPSVPNPPQAESDGDLRGDACDGCPFDFDPAQSDADHDGQGDLCDIDDGTIFLFAVDPTGFDWKPEVGYASWNAYKGDLAVLKASGVYTQPPGSNPLADRACALAVPRMADGAPPAAGSTAFYLVTGVAGGVESGLGSTGSGLPRPNDNPCP